MNPRWKGAVRDDRSLLPPDDHPDLPFEGGSEPVPQLRETVPGPGLNLVHWLVIAVCLALAIFSVIWIFGF
jgi:hypothetical protein